MAPSFTLTLCPNCQLRTHIDKMKNEGAIPYTSSTFFYRKSQFLSSLTKGRSFALFCLFLYKRKMLLTEKMLEIHETEEHGMELPETHMNKCSQKTPRMSCLLS